MVSNLKSPSRRIAISQTSISLLAAAIFGIVYSPWGSAAAQSNSNSARRECIRNTNTNAVQCVKECNSTKEDELLFCSALGNEALVSCYKACSSDKDSCLKPFQDNLRTCSDACFNTFNTGLTACEDGVCKTNQRDCQICRLTVKLTRFECADACLDAFQANKEPRAACRSTFRGCLRTCRQVNGKGR
jgi:hypothetical protein